MIIVNEFMYLGIDDMNSDLVKMENVITVANTYRKWLYVVWNGFDR